MAPHVISLYAAISACEKSGQWHPAVLLLNEIGEAHMAPDMISFNAAILACGKGGQWRCAVSVLHYLV